MIEIHLTDQEIKDLNEAIDDPSHSEKTKIKLLMLDSLHPCQQTLRQAHQENGADFLIPVKGNHPELDARAAACLPDRSSAVISPLGRAPGHEPAAGAVRYRRKRR